MTRITEMSEFPGGFGNWSRWPNLDGTLNLLSAEHVLRAASLVRSGQAFNCTRPLTALPAADGVPPEFTHRVTFVGESRPGRHAAMDRIELNLHSLVNTHLDALSHVGHLGKGFNGVPFDSMVGPSGASMASIDATPPIVTRGVLADVARHRGVEYLEPGDYVTPDELELLAGDTAPGDALLVRTGRWRGPQRLPGDPEASGDPLGDWAGLHVDCMEFVADRDIALLGTDSTTDTFPSPAPDAPTIHIVAEVYLGLPLLHSLDLDDLADACAAQKRTDFMFCVAPIKIEGATGCPVAPICIL